MMKKFDEKEEFEGLPLRLVWVYLTEKGLGNEVSSGSKVIKRE